MRALKLWSAVLTLALAGMIALAGLLALAGPLFAAKPAAGKLTLTGKLHWVVVATGQDRNTIVGIARLYEPRSVRVMRLRRGGYAAVLGPVSASNIAAFRVVYEKGWFSEGRPLAPYLAKNWLTLPVDAVLTQGEDYVEASWIPTGSGLVQGLANPSATVKSGGFSVDVSAKGGRTSFHMTVDRKPGITLTYDTPIDKDSKAGPDIVQLAWLDRSAPYPQIIVNQHSSTGLQELTRIWIVTATSSGFQLVDAGKPDLFGYYLEDIDGDGNDELCTTDPSVPQFFDDNVALASPSLIKRLVGGRLIDITDDPSSRDRLQQAVKGIEYVARQTPSFWRENSFLAGWVAAKSRVGEFDDAWSRMLLLYDPRTQLIPTVCTDGSDVLKCPKDQIREASFPEALAARLRLAGYKIPVDLSYGDPEGDKAQPNATLVPDPGNTSRPQSIPPAAKAEPATAAAPRGGKQPAPAPAPAVVAKAEDPPPQTQLYSGSGFFVAKGKLVSNAHVVKGCEDVTVRLGGVEGMGHVAARDLNNDLALIDTSVPTGPLATLRTAPRLGEAVSAFGFPLTDILATTGNFTRGNVTATAGMGDDSRFLQISAPVQPGNSGGPLLDESGNVVGVVNAKIDALVTAKLTKDIPQNINFAIKSSVLENFLEARGVRYDTGKLAQKLDPSDIADRAQSFTAIIFCKM